MKTMQNQQTKGAFSIRNETQADHRAVEELTRRAFYNLYVPGCAEHYLVHRMRGHEDFLPELDFVAELDGQLIGNVMYTRSRLVDEAGTEKGILTFGPVCIAPEHQRRGYGKRLLEHSFEKAAAEGWEAIVIFGDPGNYVGLGFKSCKKFHVTLEDGSYPAAMLVKELRPGALDGRRWVYRDSPVMQIDEEAAARFDQGFAPLEKRWQPSQESFYIYSRATVG